MIDRGQIKVVRETTREIVQELFQAMGEEIFEKVINLSPGSDIVELFISKSIREFVDKDISEVFEEKDNPFEELVGFGELVDRLSIVNIKLYNLKNEQVTLKDKDKLAASAKRDVALVKERARLKRCLDAKVVEVARRVLNEVEDGGLNEEVKQYGK